MTGVKEQEMLSTKTIGDWRSLVPFLSAGDTVDVSIEGAPLPRSFLYETLDGLYADEHLIRSKDGSIPAHVSEVNLAYAAEEAGFRIEGGPIVRATFIHRDRAEETVGTVCLDANCDLFISDDNGQDMVFLTAEGQPVPHLRRIEFLGEQK